MTKGLKSPKDEQESPLGSANNRTQVGQRVLPCEDVGFRTGGLRRVGEMTQKFKILIKAISVEWFGEKSQWGENRK